jgi:hypothetical protein
MLELGTGFAYTTHNGSKGGPDVRGVVFLCGCTARCDTKDDGAA